MGLFDGILGNKKEKTPRSCCKCGKDVTGFLSGIKIDGGNYICGDCFPSETPLMRKKGVLHKDFKTKIYTLEGIDKLCAYRAAEKERVALFKEEDSFLDGQLLLDLAHGLFKLAAYDEVFPLSEISEIALPYIENGGKYDLTCVIFLENEIYLTLPLESYVFKSNAILKKNRHSEFNAFVREFHESFCPSASLIFVPAK